MYLFLSIVLAAFGIWISPDYEVIDAPLSQLTIRGIFGMLLSGIAYFGAGACFIRSVIEDRIWPWRWKWRIPFKWVFQGQGWLPPRPPTFKKRIIRIGFAFAIGIILARWINAWVIGSIIFILVIAILFGDGELLPLKIKINRLNSISNRKVRIEKYGKWGSDRYRRHLGDDVTEEDDWPQ